ncbi:hypothetical protein MSAN_02360100 [Mycena sanguinolenta]|uniref:Uncharacterized protein n=1 Tax=Mycena sanguinolenta TaxID=230812 RepID=A0A8H7CFX7_9AGAR|nr:hypothetical protein MSAN_02360100 [Mycena sanguinolenta]
MPFLMDLSMADAEDSSTTHSKPEFDYIALSISLSTFAATYISAYPTPDTRPHLRHPMHTSLLRTSTSSMMPAPRLLSFTDYCVCLSASISICCIHAPAPRSPLLMTIPYWLTPRPCTSLHAL